MSKNTTISRLVAFLVVSIILFFSTYPAMASVFWSEGFETMPIGSIDGRDTTWKETSTLASVTGTHYHTGNQCLAVSNTPAHAGQARWYDDTPTLPHGGLVDFDWWMFRPSSSHFEFSAQGWNGTDIVKFRNYQLGSDGSIDVLNGAQWIETMAIVPEASWTHLFLEINFNLNPVQYRISVSAGADPGTWFGWYSLGNHEDYFRYLQLTEQSTTYYDDFTGSVIPEPATLSLLAFGCLATLRRRRV